MHIVMGPVLVVVDGMVKDLASFAGILVVSTLAFAVAIEGLRQPLGEEWGLSTATNLIDHYAWRIIGETFLEDLECEDPAGLTPAVGDRRLKAKGSGVKV